MKNKGKLLKKRILSFLVAAAMLCGILPANATVANAASTSVSLSSLGRRGIPEDIVEKVESVGMLESIPLWIVTLLGSLLITILSFIMLLTVYGRMFKLYMYTAIAPIPVAAFAGEPTQSIGIYRGTRI